MGMESRVTGSVHEAINALKDRIGHKEQAWPTEPAIRNKHNMYKSKVVVK